MNKTILGFILACSIINFIYAAEVEHVDMPREVKSISVNRDNITINFDKLPSFQVIYTKDKDGRMAFLEYGTIFNVKIGENIGWGDGDHHFVSIILVRIINNKAYIILSDEDRPPATHINLSRTDRREYVIDRIYIRKD